MDLANKAGMHLNALGNLERGKRNASIQTVFILCKALGVSVAKFLADVEKALPAGAKIKSSGFYDDE